jgi:hypothetical protein
MDKVHLLCFSCSMVSLFQNSLIPTGLAWEDMLFPLYQKYKNTITWGDQDLLNIIFYFNPGRSSSENALWVGSRPPFSMAHIPGLGCYWQGLNGAQRGLCSPASAFHLPPLAIWLTEAGPWPLTQKAICWSLQHCPPFLESIFLILPHHTPKNCSRNVYEAQN